MNLRELDVSWNRLTTLTIHSIREVFFTLVRLSLSGNPLYCDCQLSWLTTYSSLVDHKTTICCPEHDVRPAVCRHVVCGSEVTCSSTNSTLSVDRRSLCSQIVSSSLIAAVFQQQLTTASPVTQTVEMTSRVDDISSEVLPSLTSSVDNIDMTSTPCRAASSFDNAHRYIVVIAVVVPVRGVVGPVFVWHCCVPVGLLGLVPVLGVGLMFAIVAVVCMRRRSFVDWSDDQKRCSARTLNVSAAVTSDCSTP